MRSERGQSEWLPSGEWEGFYVYGHDSQKHIMQLMLTFSDFKISGSGVDDVGIFVWSGTYDLDIFKATLIKQYSTHVVRYNGTIDENGIWGIWELGYGFSGGFHIWPKKQKSEIKNMAEAMVNEGVHVYINSISSDGCSKFKFAIKKRAKIYYRS